MLAEDALRVIVCILFKRKPGFISDHFENGVHHGGTCMTAGA